MTKNFNTARSEYKRQLENLISSQAQAEVQNAGTRGQNAMNQTASTVSAEIDPGKIDGVKYAETLAQGIAEIKAAQQKQLEEQLKLQAQAIKAQQKAASKTTKTTKSSKSDKSESAGTGKAEESAAPDNSAEEQEQKSNEQRRSATKSKDDKNKAETSSEKKGIVQKAVGAAAAAASGLGEWLKTASPAEQQLQNELNAQAQNAAKAQADESTAKEAQKNAAKRAKAQEIKRNQASGMSNEALLKKEKLSNTEKEEIYTRVNNWLEKPGNQYLLNALELAQARAENNSSLLKRYSGEQLAEAKQYYELYNKMGIAQRLKERVGGTILGAGKNIASVPFQTLDYSAQSLKNAANEVADPEYAQATAQEQQALVEMQALEDAGQAYAYNEHGQAIGTTQQYKELQNQLAAAREIIAKRKAVLDAPVSQDSIGYQIYQSGQKNLERSNMGLPEDVQFMKGAATSAAENIAIAAVNPALVLPVLSAQGAADSMGQSTANQEAAFTGLTKGVAKGVAGYFINSVGVEQMIDTMGLAGAKSTIASKIVQSLKSKPVLSTIANNSPALYATLMGATDNGLQSFAESWADYAIDMATNTAEPMTAEQLLDKSLNEFASGALGGAFTGIAGSVVAAGRQAAYNRAQNAQNAQNAQMAPENTQNIAENTRNVTGNAQNIAGNVQNAAENARMAQIETAPVADNLKATGDNLPPVQPATDYKNTAVTAPAEQTAAAPAMRNDIIALKENLEQGGKIKPRIAQMFLKQGSTEEMKQRKQENRKALAQMLGVDESEIPTTLKATREYLEWVDPEKLVASTAEAQNVQNNTPVQSENIANVQSNAENAAAMQQAAPTPPVMRAVPTESMSAEMQQMSREIAEGTGRQVEYFESDNDRVRGAYENGKLYLNKNLNTREAAQQTVVHELTHSQEGTKTYEKMRRYIADSKILEQAAKAATNLNEPPAGMTWAEAWQQKIKEDYEAAGITADPEKEMIAKLCEKYLFFDEDAVKTVCRENMSLAESVLSWVKEMISRVRGATMEAELRHIERLYRKGIAEAKGQVEQENKGKQYKVLEDAYSGQSFVQVDEDILNGVPKSQWAKTVREEMKRRYPSGIKVDGWTIDVNSSSRNEFTNSKSTQWLKNTDKTTYQDKMRMISNLDEIINIADNVRNESLKHNRNDNYVSFNRAEALVRVGKNGYVADVVTAVKPSTKEVFYDVVNISKQKIKENRSERYSENPASAGMEQSSFVNEDRSKRYSENPASTYGKRPSNTDNIALENKNVKPGNEKQFSLADPVEETKNLVAVHNSSVEGLTESMKLGGLPSPSIAIVKAKSGHTKYGDVSLVFDKSAIDPAASKANKVYGSDAWTPTKPQVDYEISSKRAQEIDNEISQLAAKTAGGIFGRSSVLRSLGIEESTDMNISKIADKLANNDSVRAAYLAERGETLEPVKKAKEFSRKLKNEMLSNIINHVGVENIAGAVAEMEAAESYKPVEKIYDSVKEVIQKDYEQKMQKFIARKGEEAVKARVQNYMNDNWTQERVADEVRNAWEMYQDGGNSKGEIDRYATADKLREAVNKEDVKAWAKEKLSGLLGEAGIYNGKDPYTARGTRKSFQQLHNAYTLENLVAAMNKQQSARGEGLWDATASGMQAVTTPEYKNIAEIKANESKLDRVSEEEMSAALKTVDEKITNVIGLIRGETKAHSGNSYEENDIIGSLLIDNAQKKTVSSIKSAFAKDGYAISQETARQILLMYRKAAQLPTEYFEAKPQRAVGFGEVKAAIVPDNAPQKFVQELQQAGVQNVVHYEAGNEADRLAKLNELEDVRFAVEEKEGTVSREEISRGRFARAAKAKENGDSMLRALFVDEDVSEETMRSMEKAREESWEQLKKTGEADRTAAQKVLDKSANGIAWNLKREYHSAADRTKLKSQLIDLYADMEGKNTTMEEALSRAREIGAELVQQARPERRANEELMEAYGDAYRSATEKTIKLTDSEMQSLLYRWGSMKEFRRDTGNKIRVSTEDGTPIDTLWGELNELSPGKFAADTNDGDMLGEIADFVNELRPQEVQRYAGVEKETAEEIGDKIIDGFMAGKVRSEKERVRKELQKQVRQQVKKGVERLNADNYEYRQELAKERKKIERMAERMGKKLARPTKQQHIVADADVQLAVRSIADDALGIVTGRFAGESKLPYVGQKLVALSQSLTNLATTDHRYAGFMTTDEKGDAIPVEFVRNLNNLAEAMNKIHQENPSISDLDLETARKLRETLERVEHELDTADKLLSDTIGAEHRESAEKTAQEVYKEIDESRRLSTYNKSIGAKLFRAAGDKAVKYNFGVLNPTRVARMMTNYAKNSAFVEVADAINRGQRKMMLLKSQASAIFADVSNDEFTLGMKKENRKSKTGLGYTKADYDAFSGRSAKKLDVGFRDADTGETVYITPAMRAELAMHLMNAHNRERVLYGGLMIPDVEQLCKGNTQEAAKLSHRVKFDLSDPDAAMMTLADIVDGMSDYEAQWIKAAKEYFWSYSGKQYNKVTIDLWGYEAANVANYYPADSDAKNLYQNVAQRGQANFTAENNSNMKERVFRARKPIALNEINRTARKSIDTMSRFCGLAMPLRDFEKIYNYQEQEGGKNIKGVMDRVWNGKAGKYWEDVMADINGSRSKDKDGISKFFAKFRGNYATSVLYANASTAMKQAASFPTAAAAIGWKPLAEGLANYKNVGQETLTEINKRVATYSMRNGDGNSVYDVGDTSSLLAQTVNKLPGAGWITKADDATVKVLSAAAKAYVDENIGNLQKGSAEYWDKVADVYADCIELTQPNNGTMQLSALSRSQSELVRGVTMFSNQRIQNYGLMWDAVADLHAQQARLKAEPGNAELQAEVKRAKVKFANTMSAMAVQSLMIGLMTAAGKALWRKMDDYRDDTGEVTSKSFWTKIMWDSLGSFGSNFMGISDIVDIGRYLADKDYTHYDFAIPELEAINDFVDKARNLSLAMQKNWANEDPEKDEELKENLRKAEIALAEESGMLLGVPLVNLRKNISGVWNGVLGEINGDGWLGEYEYTNENLRSMMDDYMAGSYDVDGINEMLEKWCVSKYGKAFGDMEKADRDTAASAMRDQAAQNWKEAYINGTDAEREEIAEKLGAIRVGDRKLFTTKAVEGWVDNWEKQLINKDTQERTDQLFAEAVEGLTGQKLYNSMTEEEQMDLESNINEAARTAAKLEAQYTITSDLGEGDKYLYKRVGKNKEKWLALKTKYIVVAAQAKKMAKKGESGEGMAEFLRALEKSGYSTADMGALLQAKGGSNNLENVSDEVRLAYYQAKTYYEDDDNSGGMNQKEFKKYVEKSGMKESVANEIWNLIWTPGKEGSASPYQ